MKRIQCNPKMVRIKHRYLLVKFLYPENTRSQLQRSDTIAFHAPTPDSFDSLALARLVRRQVAELFGDYGIGMVGKNLVVKYLSPATSTAIIRCPRDHYRLVWAALTMVTELPKPRDESKEPTKPCVFRVVRVSGTIKKIELEAIRWAKKQIWQAKDHKVDSSSGILQTFAKQQDFDNGQKCPGVTQTIEDTDSEMEEESEG